MNKPLNSGTMQEMDDDDGPATNSGKVDNVFKQGNQQMSKKQQKKMQE